MSNNENNGFSGLLALWGPLILIGALVFVFQVEHHTQEEVIEPKTEPHLVLAKQAVQPQQSTELVNETEAFAGGKVDVADKIVLEPQPVAVDVAKSTIPVPQQTLAVPPVVSTEIVSAAPLPVTTVVATDAKNLAYILAYPPISGPYRRSFGWQASSLRNHHPWHSSSDTKWVPCAPPYHWCRPPARPYIYP